MELAAFLLDRWISRKHTSTPPIEFDLASSTGPVGTLRELIALDGQTNLDSLLDMRVSYVSAAGTPELRTAIAKLSGVEPEHVQVVTGAEEALLILFFLAAEPRANILLPSPGFPVNAALAHSLGLETRFYGIRAENGFAINPDEIRKLVDSNTKLVLVNTPHNPTGSVPTNEELEALCDFCVELGVQFVSDEVYHPIYHGPAMNTAARLRHATVIGDFSKALCLSGLPRVDHRTGCAETGLLSQCAESFHGLQQCAGRTSGGPGARAQRCHLFAGAACGEREPCTARRAPDDRAGAGGTEQSAAGCPLCGWPQGLGSVRATRAKSAGPRRC
jgi:Aminotransferase class I and II